MEPFRHNFSTFFLHRMKQLLKISLTNQRISCRITIAAGLVIAAFLFASGLTAAENNPADNVAPTGEQIQITADKLVSHSGENYAEFIGNVEATQGSFVMRSDRLRIFYRRGADITKSKPSGGEAIDKIVAIGNVKIKSDNRQAETEYAEYTVNDGNLVLTGENSTVTDGKNSIKGSKITLNRINGRITVEGNEKNRVKAIFFSNRSTTPTKGDDKAGQSDGKTP